MITIIVVCLLVTLAIGYFLRLHQHNKELDAARIAAQRITNHGKAVADSEAQSLVKKQKRETKDYQENIEQELNEDLEDNQKKENWLEQRSSVLKQKEELLNHRNDAIQEKQNNLKQQRTEVQETLHSADELTTDRLNKLHEVAGLTADEAKDEVLDDTTQEVKETYDEYVKDSEAELESTSERDAQNLVELAMEHSGGKTVVHDSNRSLIVDNNEALGKIIGNAGQNVRTLEALTGIDIIIDDKEKEVILNGYDPVRREIANRVIKKIQGERRVNPDIIEKIVNETNIELDREIRRYGEDAVMGLGIRHIAPDLIKFIGRMQYRTSYGQNILEHSKETARLAGIFAAELGEDPVMARRAGLLHDIGKSIDRDIDATHVEIGVELATQYRESPVVINTIASHHGDVESEYVIADLVEAADAISGARQGARSESAADYLQRIRSLEGIANDQPVVKESYAIQAGRELRVIVQPNETSDKTIHSLATKVKDEIEDKVTYPGQVKVTVVRKLEIVEYAEKKRA